MTSPSAEELARRWGLTPAQARVAERLARGQSVREIAAELGVSRSTVRTHLKAIFAHTDTHRQAQLVQRLLTEGQGPHSHGC